MNVATSLRIGTFFRTRIRIHYTWILVFIMVPWAVSTQFSTETALTTRLIVGAITAVLFFFAVFLREIALLLFAVMKNIRVKTVTIFAFGGLIRTDGETDSPSLELLLAVAGMLCNLAVTAIFYFSSLFFNEPARVLVQVPLKWLAFFYLTLTLFHVIPAYPLEGGRMLHALLWRVTDNFRKATRIAGISGWAVGFLIMAGGIALIVLTVERFTGMFFIGLGLIVQNAATRGVRQMRELPFD